MRTPAARRGMVRRLRRSLVVVTAVLAAVMSVAPAATGQPGGSESDRPAFVLRHDGRGHGPDYSTSVAYDGGTGERRWIRNYDGPDHDCDQAYSIAASPDGSAVFVTGSSFSFGTDSDIATVAYAVADGTELWASRFDGPSHLYDSGDSVIASPDGSRVYVAGLSTGATTDFDFMTLFHDAASGAIQRAERYDGPGHGFDAPNAIAVHPSGRLVYTTGGSTGLGGAPDFATVAYRA